MTRSHKDAIRWQTATALAGLIRSGDLSPVEVVAASMERIDEVDPELNAFTAVYRDEATAAAHAAERSVRNGESLSILHGVPVAIKDMTPVAGQRTTYGSRLYADNVSVEDAWIVKALRKSGAIIVGKTTTPEFAHSSFTQSPLFGITRHPKDPSRTPGGSSGGSAVAVATGIVPLAEGTDMGGSVRIPAALCGIVGMKPSLGRIPMDILPSVFDDISHFGPLARTCEDAALFLTATQGPDDCDIQSITAPFRYDRGLPDPRGLRLALSLDFGFYALDRDVRENTLRAAQALRDAGATVEEVDLGWDTEILAIWMDYWRVFMAAYFEEAYRRGADRLDPAVRRLIEQGQALSAVAYKKREMQRSALWRAFSPLLATYDALLCPTMALAAPPATCTDRDFGTMDEEGYHGLDMTAPFNLFGQCPAISVSSGVTKEGLPTALQIVGKRFSDAPTLAIAALVESLIDMQGPNEGRN